MALVRERKFGAMAFGGISDSLFFPTEHGWSKFCDYVDKIASAEPFASRCTRSDVRSAFSQAMGNLLRDGLLPDCTLDLLQSAPPDFIQYATTRSEQRFYGIGGIEVTSDIAVHVAECWISKFEDIAIADLLRNDEDFKSHAMEALGSVFSNKSPVLICPRRYGSPEKVRSLAITQSDLAISALAVMFRLTYQHVFENLGRLCRIDSPYQGLKKHVDFHVSRDDGETARFGIGTQYGRQPLALNGKAVERWHQELSLTRLNQIARTPETSQTELERRIVRALLYFRHATQTDSIELQVATLWTPVESFFTLGAEPGTMSQNSIACLSAVTHQTAVRAGWPGWTGLRPKDLRKKFTKLYGHRSRSYHHGELGHVSQQDVEHLSVAVAALIVVMIDLSSKGFTNAKDVRQAILDSAQSQLG